MIILVSVVIERGVYVKLEIVDDGLKMGNPSDYIGSFWQLQRFLCVCVERI